MSYTTTVITCSPDRIDSTVIAQAAQLLAAGELVAFPTETVYGLGADALNPAAVAKIFLAKNRPADNPLIVHISNPKQLTSLVRTIPPAAQTLIDAFWPGPLSIVFPKHQFVPDITTGGLATVVVRFPSHPIAQALIEASDTPIAAPSANLSGKVSPTLAAHVLTDLSGRIPLIIDGGSIEHGLESTVIDCTTTPLTILRPGSITREMLEAVLGPVLVATSDSPVKSPGMKYRHYSPTAPVLLFSGSPAATAHAMQAYLGEHPDDTAVLWHSGDFAHTTTHIQLPVDTTLAAPHLFAALRSLDTPAVSVILVQGYDSMHIGSAMMNRLHKAATRIIEV